MIEEDEVKVSIIFTLFLLAGFFVFTSYAVLFDDSLDLGYDNVMPQGSISGFAILLEDRQVRDSFVIWLTIAIVVSVIALVFYLHYKSKQIEEYF